MKPGFDTFSGLPEILMTGTNSPSFSRATSLYTPPSAGWSAAVISWVPMPQLSILAPWAFSPAMMCSSKSLDATIFTSGKPASSSMRRACWDKYAKSPLSRRMAFKRLPRLASCRAVAMAFGTPLRSVS
ncbi:hypothetical protein D3C86_1550540 [compost metagenome]